MQASRLRVLAFCAFFLLPSLSERSKYTRCTKTQSNVYVASRSLRDGPLTGRARHDDVIFVVYLTSHVLAFLVNKKARLKKKSQCSGKNREIKGVIKCTIAPAKFSPCVAARFCRFQLYVCACVRIYHA